jgi:vacuolar-type H+-ATPase subunit I/STV1
MLPFVFRSIQQISDVALFVSTIFHVFFSMSLIFANGYYMRNIRENLAKDMHQLVVSVGHTSCILPTAYI